MTTPLPSANDLVQTGINKATFKAALSALRAYLNTLLGADGTQSSALAALGAPFNATLVKSGAYTVAAADRGKVIKCTGTWTLAFSDAAALGDGFMVAVVNDGSGTITLDPYLTQQVANATTLALGAGESLVIYVDGTELLVFGRSSLTSFNGRTGAISLTAGDVTGVGGALAANVVPVDVYGHVGEFRMLSSSSSGTYTRGSSYTAAVLGFGSGTDWRCLDFAPIAISESTTYLFTFQRIS